MRKLIYPLLAFGLASALSASNLPVVIEAASGALGDDWQVLEADGVEYITIATNVVLSQAPGNAERVASYTLSFEEAGTYELYAKIYIGPQPYDDDSLFYGNGFGEMDPTEGDDWITVNNLADPMGYNAPDEVVRNGGLLDGGGHWKWVKLTGFDFADESIAFPVEADALEVTFQIGAREDGLRIGKLAFGREGIVFTVNQLENGLPGVEDVAQSEFVPAGPPRATGHEKFLGSAHSPSQTLYFERYWNQITSENGSKWGSVEATRGEMNWGGADAAYAIAQENGFPFRWHVLVWGNQQPAWMEDLPVDEQLEEIHEWFAAVAERYPDVAYVEVVNEPLHDPPTPGNGGYYTALGGEGETGWDWVLNAFRIAREYFPDTPLMINDYNILSSFNNATRYLEIIELLQAEDLVDIIGVQGHAFSTRGSTANLVGVLDLLGETGLPIQVTEMDIDGPTDEAQLASYERIFPALWEHPSVMGITLWGYRIGLWRTAEGAYLINDDSTERPAMEWLTAYLREGTGIGEPYLGYDPILNGDWIDTDGWLGMLYIAHRPWVYSELIGWLWIAEETDSASGAWLYAPQ